MKKWHENSVEVLLLSEPHAPRCRLLDDEAVLAVDEAGDAEVTDPAEFVIGLHGQQRGVEGQGTTVRVLEDVVQLSSFPQGAA